LTFHNSEGFEIVDEKPDFTIVFGKIAWDKIETPKEKTFFFTQEPLFSQNEQRYNLHEYCSKIFIADKRLYPDRDEYIETLVPMFYGGSGEYHDDPLYDWSVIIEQQDFNKTKNISCIVTKDYRSYYDPLEKDSYFKINNKDRTDLGIALSQIQSIDIYGRHWEKNDINIFGETWNKHVGLNDYRFSVCSENCIQKNYISEKFWDAILTDCVPIYFGCSNISEYISPDCYVDLNGLTLDEMVKKIKDIDKIADSYYESHKNCIKQLKQEFFKNPLFNIWEKIKQEVSNC
jgi:hypothetical protein